MSQEKYTVVGLGELLWDILPSRKQLGGAPANFAYIATLLGDEGIVASRVKMDAPGKEALALLQERGQSADAVQHDALHPTGTVTVDLDVAGKPSFTITEEVAWDYLEWTAEWKALAEQSDAVCFGSLAQRSPQSRETIRRFLAAVRPEALIVFDVNLRTPFYSAQVIGESLQRANVVKLNDEELPLMMQLCGLGEGSEETGARRVLEAYDLQLVCLTRGARGSVLLTRTQVVEHRGFCVEVVDTVGAGDAFTAALVHHYLRNASLEQISEKANRTGAWVATQAGATPPVDEESLRRLI
jgi:fructokinase